MFFWGILFSMNENWSLDELRWYLDAPEPEYRLYPWWKNKGSSAAAESVIDENDPLIHGKDTRNRSRVLLEPWLWEILRRHPELHTIRRGYREVLDAYPLPGDLESAFEGWNQIRLNFLKPWEDRGQELIEFLARFGHLAWSTTKEGIEGDVHEEALGQDYSFVMDRMSGSLTAHEREEFSIHLVAFASSIKNFKEGLRLPINSPVCIPRPPQEPSGQLVRDGSGFRPASPSDFSIAQYEQAAKQRGRKLVLFEIDQRVSAPNIAAKMEEILKDRFPDLGKIDEGSTPLRLRADRLELMADLDQRFERDQPYSERKLNAAKLDRIREVFRQFKLSAID